MKTEVQLKQTIDKLTAQVRVLNGRINETRDEISRRFEQPVMRKNIGKCYKYRNSYGGDGFNWWRYRRIFDVVDGRYWTIAVEADYDGEIMIRESRWNKSTAPGEIEIDEGEYLRAVKKILDRLNQCAGRTKKP